MSKPEEQARQNIDRALEAAGWVIQDYKSLNLGAGLGVAVREYPTIVGPADYALFVKRKAVGILEAKAVGQTLSGVSEQSTGYASGFAPSVPAFMQPLPFVYESTGVETFFRDLRDPDSRSRRLFSFHRPETLLGWAEQASTLRARLRESAPLITAALRDCQVEAVQNLEVSLADNRPRALIQMATGSGKTFTAITAVYRLLKFSKAKRVLFLVDRNNLGKQALTEFQQYVTPDDGRKFTELYNMQHLKSNKIADVKVVITTIQRLYSMLRGEAELDPTLEETSAFDSGVQHQRPVDVQYNPAIPLEFFDFVIIDECHRSIYTVWKQVLDYFDSFLIGLTATPSKQTLGFFNRNIVTEYSHQRAVADGVNGG